MPLAHVAFLAFLLPPGDAAVISVSLRPLTPPAALMSATPGRTVKLLEPRASAAALTSPFSLQAA